MAVEISEKTKESRPLFIAPVDMQGGDEIVFWLQQPILIRRAGVTIWRDPDLPDYVLDAVDLLEQP